jgi:hypothetical protein
MTKIYPKAGQVYTLAEIQTLYLRDSECLMGEIAGRQVVIQNTHLQPEEFLAVPGASESQWRYVRETEEWIPVFRYAGPENGMAAFCDMSWSWDWSGKCYDRSEPLHVVPKGYPMRQYEEPEGNGGAVTLEQLLAE